MNELSLGKKMTQVIIYLLIFNVCLSVLSAQTEKYQRSVEFCSAGWGICFTKAVESKEALHFFGRQRQKITDEREVDFVCEMVEKIKKDKPYSKMIGKKILVDVKTFFFVANGNGFDTLGFGRGGGFLQFNRLYYIADSIFLEYVCDKVKRVFNDSLCSAYEMNEKHLSCDDWKSRNYYGRCDKRNVYLVEYTRDNLPEHIRQLRKVEKSQVSDYDLIIREIGNPDKIKESEQNIYAGYTYNCNQRDGKCSETMWIRFQKNTLALIDVQLETLQ